MHSRCNDGMLSLQKIFGKYTLYTVNMRTTKRTVSSTYQRPLTKRQGFFYFSFSSPFPSFSNFWSSIFSSLPKRKAYSLEFLYYAPFPLKNRAIQIFAALLIRLQMISTELCSSVSNKAVNSEIDHFLPTRAFSLPFTGQEHFLLYFIEF